MQIKLNSSQKGELERLWFIYGNGGKKHTMGNHKFIQGFLENKSLNFLNFYDDVTSECYEAVGKFVDLKTLEKAMRKEFTIGDYVYYRTKNGDTVPAKVVKTFPKTVTISGNFIDGDKTVRVSKSKVELQIT